MYPGIVLIFAASQPQQRVLAPALPDPRATLTSGLQWLLAAQGSWLVAQGFSALVYRDETIIFAVEGGGDCYPWCIILKELNELSLPTVVRFEDWSAVCNIRVTTIFLEYNSLWRWNQLVTVPEGN
ncbi:hypothetical protein VPNG_01154 [Cytospora leucostoma]|uniref:Uncharacterized protein n=1 Tax=Cytospora leucostoma TaxID=1230097 RepID=A0A423XKQ7_9PEZI|nr:hypothetical protein VPNG_01154 [Cytospora leucostoma]